MEKTEFQRLLEESGIGKRFIYTKLNLSPVTYDKRIVQPIELTCKQVQILSSILKMEETVLYKLVTDPKNNLQ